MKKPKKKIISEEGEMKKKKNDVWVDNIMMIFIIIALCVAVIVSSIFLIGRMPQRLTAIEKRLPKNSQMLATECYVDEKIRGVRAEIPKEKTSKVTSKGIEVKNGIAKIGDKVRYLGSNKKYNKGIIRHIG